MIVELNQSKELISIVLSPPLFLSHTQLLCLSSVMASSIDDLERLNDLDITEYRTVL